MAAPSEVKAGLDAVAQTIARERNKLKAAKTAVSDAVAVLGALPTTYADVLATVAAYDVNTTDLSEGVAVAEIAALTAEFTQLRTKAQAAKTALNGMAFDHE